MTVLIPPAINTFLNENDFGTVELEELSVYTVLKDKYSKDAYVDSAVVIDEEDDVLLKWTYIQEDSRFIVLVDTVPYNVPAECVLQD